MKSHKQNHSSKEKCIEYSTKGKEGKNIKEKNWNRERERDRNEKRELENGEMTMK